MNTVEQARPLPDLKDTRTAFKDKNDQDLREAELLFRFMGHRVLSRIGQRLGALAVKLGLPVGGIIKRTVFKWFCGGETIGESLRTAEKLHRSGIGAILDYSAEGQANERSFDANAAEILRTIEAARGRKEVPFCVFKPTGISSHAILEKISSNASLTSAEKEEWERVKQRVEKLCKAAYDAGMPMLIDAEESWTQQAVDDLVEAMMIRFNTERPIVFNTLQLYRHDRLSFLGMMIGKARDGNYHLGVKLVRGAYMEKERDRAKEKGYPSPIHPDKQRVDRDYDEAQRLCIANIDRMAVVSGSHNENSALLLADLMQEKGIARNDRRVWFSQLLGMSDNISYNMAAAGYNVVKYVPYGPVKKVLPYLIRRAEENSSVAGQTGRELRMIREELQRRRMERA